MTEKRLQSLKNAKRHHAPDGADFFFFYQHYCQFPLLSVSHSLWTNPQSNLILSQHFKKLKMAAHVFMSMLLAGMFVVLIV